VAVVLLGSMIVAGRALEAHDIDPNTWLADTAAPAPARTVAVAPAPAPAPAPEPFTIKHILPIDGPIKYGEWHWDESGAPATGPIVVTVDLEARVLSVFRDGYEIGATAVMLGTDQHPTPLGVFPILSKERHNVSETYGNAPMPWTLRLTGDGVAIHGGAAVERGWASHGCIGTPNEFVSKLFAIAKVGDRVIITRGQTATVGTPLA
jgi:lipoprotein-anchoring transpeptidase ErfK/SrfK